MKTKVIDSTNSNKSKWYEVLEVKHLDDTAVILAKFSKKGDAFEYANMISKRIHADRIVVR